MKLVENEVHVWKIDLNLAEATITAPYSTLSPDELARAMKYKFDVHRKQYAHIRYALRKILSFYLNSEAKHLHFIYQPQGKPTLPAAFGLSFNLSHSEHLGIIAVSHHEHIGVDIEKMKPDFNLALIKRFFTLEEYNALMELSDSQKMIGFYTLWSKKEALLKASGHGLFRSLNSFSVNCKAIPETIDWDNRHWSLVPLTIDPNYQASLATSGLANDISYWNFFEHINKGFNPSE